MTRAKICFAFLMVGVLWGSFGLGGRCGFFEGCGTGYGIVAVSKKVFVGNDPCVVPFFEIFLQGLNLHKGYPLCISKTKRVRSRTLQKNTSQKTKNFPQEHPPKHSETNFRHIRAGALGESSRERGRFGGREPLFQEGLSPSKVFLTFSPLSQPERTNRFPARRQRLRSRGSGNSPQRPRGAPR